MQPMRITGTTKFFHKLMKVNISGAMIKGLNISNFMEPLLQNVLLLFFNCLHFKNCLYFQIISFNSFLSFKTHDLINIFSLNFSRIWSMIKHVGTFVILWSNFHKFFIISRLQVYIPYDVKFILHLTTK